jgi:hypothetical protein
MLVAELNSSGASRSSDVAAARRRKYVAPSLSRYGTLADLTRSNGFKDGNDSQGPGKGCGGGNNFLFSCIKSEGT